jgi:hypothetical protein
MSKYMFLVFVSIAVIGPSFAIARSQARTKFQARLVAKDGESQDISSAREAYFEDKDAEERFAALAKSTREGGSCYVCHQKGSKRPLNAFGWAGEQLAMRKSPGLTKARVDEIFQGKDTDEKNKLTDLFTDAALEALDYWVVLNTDGELELVKDAKDAAGDPLSFGRRVAQGYLPTTDVKEKSFESVFPQEVLDKLLALQPE